MAPKPSRWLHLFESFVQDLRIASKEVVSDDQRGVKLELWESQRRFLKELSAGLDQGVRSFYCLKSRQLGCTTISLAIDVFWLAVHNNLIGALVTDTENNRDANRSMISRYVASFPEGYFDGKFSITANNRSFIEFSNGSRLNLLVAGTKKKSIAWGEGQGYAFCHETEISKYGDVAGLNSLEESFAQTNPNRLFIRESTANGFNHWRTSWLSGFDDPYTKRSFFIGWWANDMNRIERSDPRFASFSYRPTAEERELIKAVRDLYEFEVSVEQLAWIRWKETQPDEAGILNQNQPWLAEQAFLLSGQSFFPLRSIGQDMKRISDSPDEYGFQAYRYELGNSFFDTKLEQLADEEDRDRIELRVWEEPVDSGYYTIGFDTAWGRNDNKDRNSISIMRCYADKIIQVAEYATADHDVKHASWVLAHLAGAYRNCLVNVELNGPGRTVMMEWEHLRDLMNAEFMADHVQARAWDDFLGQARWYLYNRPDTMGRGYAANFETTMRTKYEIMFQMRGAYVTKELEIRSLKLLHEMRIVVQDGSEIGAPESRGEDSKDDRVFSAALAIRAWINWTRRELLGQGLTYERSRDEETGNASVLSRSLNSRVYSYFKTREEIAEQMANDPPRGPKWLNDRNLV